MPPADLPRKKIVILIHGIRTQGEWNEMVAPILGDDNTTIIPIKYQYLDVFRFIFPFFTRLRAISEIHWKLSRAIFENKDAELVIIAHSFGTYAISKILKENPMIDVSRMILCGSIVSPSFKWGELRNLPTIVNECGAKDIWPILAASITWGFGASGTFGFGTPEVRDRFHNFFHSDYFDRDFVDHFWKPFVQTGQYIQSDFSRNRPPTPWWMSALPVLPVRAAIVSILCLILMLAINSGTKYVHVGKHGCNLPPKTPGEMTREVYDLFEEGRSQFAKSNYQKSITCFTKAIKQDPDNYILYLNRSVVYLQGNQSRESSQDVDKAMDLYSSLGTQQKKREKSYALVILNQLLNVRTSTGENQKAIEEYGKQRVLVEGEADTLMRIHNNMGNAYLGGKQWNESAEEYDKTLTLARSLENHPMEVKASINLSNSYYWIIGKELSAYESADSALTLLDTYKLDEAVNAEMKAAACNAKGLAMMKANERGVRNFEPEVIIKNYSEGIETLREFTSRSETEYLLHANLIANRADAHLFSGDIESSRTDFRTACNLFINRGFRDGISRQLVGLFKVAKRDKSSTNAELYALILMAQKLGQDKPSVQKDEDQQLRSDIEPTLTNAEKSQIKSKLNDYVGVGSGIPANTWDQF